MQGRLQLSLGSPQNRGSSPAYALSPRLSLRIFIALPIWGDFYVRTFLEWSLPTLLAPGNLRQGPFKPQNTYVLLYTNSVSRQQLEADPLFQQFAATVPIQWNLFETPKIMPHRFYKHTLMSACYADAALLASEHQMALMPLTADNLFSEGAFERIVAAGAQADLVMLAGLRISWSAIRALAPYHQGNSLNIQAADLIGFVLKYPHPHFLACFIDAPLFTVWPSHVYYRIDSASFQARCFHLHPILISRPRPFVSVPKNTSPDLNNLDGHYLQQYYAAGAQLEILNDPELAGVTLSRDEDVSMLEKALSPLERQEQIAAFGRNYCLPVHQYFFKQIITFQAQLQS